MTFTVLIHDAEGGGFWAEVPELPGCASQGETLDELELNVREAILACLQARMDDDGSVGDLPTRRGSIAIEDADLQSA